MEKFVQKTRKRQLQDDNDSVEEVESSIVEETDEPKNNVIDTNDTKLNFNYLFENFFTVISINVKKLNAVCQNCQKVICGSTSSSGNFLSHIKLKHPGLMDKLKSCRERYKKPKNVLTQSKLCHMTSQAYNPISTKLSKEKITDLVFNYILQEMRPLSTCEKPAFKNLIKGLTNNEEIYIPDHRVIGAKLNEDYKAYVTKLTEQISMKSYICTTADIWSCNNKSYFGMTVHFIDETTFKRSSYALACRRIQGSHNYINIAKTITDILNNFCINVTKISHTVTDNASNFGKAFRVYNQQYIASNVTTDTTNDTNDLNTSIDVDVTDMSSIIDDIQKYISNEHIDDDEELILLPNHMTCSAHILNLIATIDTTNITEQKYRTISRSTFGKINAFWNILSRSSTASDKVFKICNCKFPVPVVTRWNSFFDAIQKLVLHQTNVTEAINELKLTKLKSTEWSFLQEYCQVVEPLATSLDKLQGEDSCFLGFVAPTILSLMNKLMNTSHLVYCQPLCSAISKGLEKRFKAVLDLNLPESKPYILASVSHPKFRLNWVPPIFIQTFKSLFLSECNLVGSINSSQLSQSTNSEDSDDFFECIMPSSQLSDTYGSCSLSANVQALTFLDIKKKETKNLHILNQYPIVKQVFLKYNTTLPSSAPVERLFSAGSQILTPRRNRLKDNTFEQLLCLRSTKE
ncbi:hypothetical protein AGLY_017237 [Aphis glycines]|uniref:HAT C-terminal dimerisation domain-containing protein n=2 Tax=Aphis TaxID=464929 RepID=A0A6G0SVL5_APHGL|nr:hypothetical protein AGLY_017237 [Aphis glycines]